MNAFTHVAFATMFASSIGSLDAPLFDDRKHETFVKSKTEWVLIVKGKKSNGLQKFSVGNISVYALDIERAIEKLCRRVKVDPSNVWKVSDSYYLKIKA